jgi:hypothetical protein
VGHHSGLRVTDNPGSHGLDFLIALERLDHWRRTVEDRDRLAVPAAELRRGFDNDDGLFQRRLQAMAGLPNSWDIASRFFAARSRLIASLGLYSAPVLGLIFLRFAEVRFAAQRVKLEKAGASCDGFRPACRLVAAAS